MKCNTFRVKSFLHKSNNLKEMHLCIICNECKLCSIFKLCIYVATDLEVLDSLTDTVHICQKNCSIFNWSCSGGKIYNNFRTEVWNIRCFSPRLSISLSLCYEISDASLSLSLSLSLFHSLSLSETLYPSILALSPPSLPPSLLSPLLCFLLSLSII